MLVVVMIETLEGVANAEEIAATHGVDVVLIGNNDLSSFSGWAQNDPRYQDALIKVHDAALKYGKYFGNAGAQYLNGYVLSADTRMVQNGPARDGWTPPGRGGGPEEQGAARGPGRGRGDGAPEPDPEPVIGLPGGVPARNVSPRPWRPRSSRGPRCGILRGGVIEGSMRQGRRVIAGLALLACATLAAQQSRSVLVRRVHGGTGSGRREDLLRAVRELPR